jgi:hypothetical protein
MHSTVTALRGPVPVVFRGQPLGVALALENSSLYYHKLVCCNRNIIPPRLLHPYITIHIFPSLRATMTDAHERITLPPISSFENSPSIKHHSQFQAGPSRRGAHIHRSSSWAGSSAGSNHLRNELDDRSYRCETFTLRRSMLLTAQFFRYCNEYEGRMYHWGLKDWPPSTDYKAALPLYDELPTRWNRHKASGNRPSNRPSVIGSPQ